MIAAMLAPIACRDDVGPFQPTDRPVNRSEAVRLTYSPRNDFAPAWSLDGDSVYYSAEGFETQPSSPGVLVRIPRDGGSGAPLLNVQSEGSRTEHYLAGPTPDPAGGRMAFVEIVQIWAPHPCSLDLTSLSCTPPRAEEDARRPPLRSIAVRARASDATQPLEDDPSLAFAVPGVTLDFDTGVVSIVHFYPFQQLFVNDRTFGLRASWAPGGERLALSDGLQLFIWTVGDSTATPITNTGDGIWPAWSPDGEWIAFTRLERADSTGATCEYRGDMGQLICVQERTEYVTGRHVLSLVRTDGSDLTELGDGDEPAWAPDGSEIFFHRGGQIWRSAPDGTNARAVPETEGGHQPAVSPDGLSLAIAKLNASGDYDIWIVPLAP
jgi:hypothetical protein